MEERWWRVLKIKIRVGRERVCIKIIIKTIKRKITKYSFINNAKRIKWSF